MNYLPVRCDACATVSLVPDRSCTRGNSICPECRGIASVLPGCAYAEEDLGLFEDLRTYLQRAGLSPVDLCELAVMMDQMRLTQADAEMMAVLLEYVPTLAPALTVLTSRPAKLRPALNMLSTLIHQRAYERTSGMVESPRALEWHRV